MCACVAKCVRAVRDGFTKKIPSASLFLNYIKSMHPVSLILSIGLMGTIYPEAPGVDGRDLKQHRWLVVFPGA